jgi:hypothetical protein
MDSEEEERLRQWKQHLASQGNDVDDSDDLKPDCSFDDGGMLDRGRGELSAPNSSRLPRRPSAHKKQNESLRDSLLENANAEEQSIDWASALMPQLRELQDENALLKAKAAAHEKEVRRLLLEQQSSYGVDSSTSDGSRVGGDLKDSKIVELAKKNRSLTVHAFVRPYSSAGFLRCRFL